MLQNHIKADEYYMCLKNISGYDSFLQGKIYSSLVDDALVNENGIEVKVAYPECFRKASKDELDRARQMAALGIRIRQLNDGVQKRAYGDHVWEWELVTNKPKEEVLEICRKVLKGAAREHSQYLAEYREPGRPFDSLMEVVCGGYYSLVKTETGWRYKVTKEYID